MAESTADTRFIQRVTEKLGRKAMTHVRFKIPSKTLRKAMHFRQSRPGVGHVIIPHYWALYVHDGRGPFGPRGAQFLVWFRNPKEDPRLRAGTTPVRAHQLKKLTAQQFKEGLRRNREHLAAGRKRHTMPMIVTKRVRKRQRGSFFFHNRGGMGGFVQKADAIVEKDFLSHLRRRVPRAFQVEEDPAVISF